MCTFRRGASVSTLRHVRTIWTQTNRLHLLACESVVCEWPWRTALNLNAYQYWFIHGVTGSISMHNDSLVSVPKPHDGFRLKFVYMRPVMKASRSFHGDSYMTGLESYSKNMVVSFSGEDWSHRNKNGQTCVRSQYIHVTTVSKRTNISTDHK
jgi:hypothetical protein